MGTPITRMRTTRDEAVSLEIIEQGDQGTRRDVGVLSKAMLGERPDLGEDAKDTKAARFQGEGGHQGVKALRLHGSEKRQHKSDTLTKGAQFVTITVGHHSYTSGPVSNYIELQ